MSREFTPNSGHNFVLHHPQSELAQSEEQYQLVKHTIVVKISSGSQTGLHENLVSTAESYFP